MRKGSSAGIFESVDVRNSKDLTEAEEVKKRWQEYIEELYKRDLMTQIITMV